MFRRLDFAARQGPSVPVQGMRVWTGYLGISWFGGTLTTNSVPTQAHYACAINGSGVLGQSRKREGAEPPEAPSGQTLQPTWSSCKRAVDARLQAGCARRLRFPVGGSGRDAELLRGLGKGDPATTLGLQILPLLRGTIVILETPPSGTPSTELFQLFQGVLKSQSRLTSSAR